MSELIQFDGRTVAVIAPEDLEQMETEIDRLRSGVRCPHCDELRLELGEVRREIERLRTENNNLHLEMRSLLQVTVGTLTDVEIQRDYGMLGWSVVKRCGALVHE